MIESAWPKQHLFGVPINAMTIEQVAAASDRAIETRQRLLIGVVNAAKLVNLRHDPVLAAAVLDADLILADGMSVVAACRLLRRPLPQRVAGIDLMHALFNRADQRGYRVFFLGATDEVLAAVLAYVRQHHPNLVIAGSHHGYFASEQEPQVAAAIKAARADILLVAISSPKKEQFIARWQDELAVPVCHGVGGSFDVLAGKVRRAPRWMQRLGLEWFYRLIQEPGRLWKRYLVTNTTFVYLVLKEALFGPAVTVAAAEPGPPKHPPPVESR